MKKAKNDSQYFFWSASIILCMLLACFALIFTSCAKDGEDPVTPSPSPIASDDPAVVDPNTPAEPADPNTPTDPADPNTPADPVIATGDARLAATDDMGQEYIDKFSFLGDSTTYGLAHYKVVPATRVWTPASGTLSLFLWEPATIVNHADGSEATIAETATKLTPEYLLVTLGVNGVATMEEKDFISDYTNMVKAIQAASPNTKIILNSIYPIEKDYYGITNTKIDAANIWIEGVAKTLGLKYSDSASVLKDDTGALLKSMSNGDGLHLNTEGFNAVLNYLRTHGWQ